MTSSPESRSCEATMSGPSRSTRSSQAACTYQRQQPSTVIWQAVISLLTATMDKTPKKEPDSIHLPVSWMETHLIDELFSLFISSRTRLEN